MKRTRVALYFGSFNPIHLGHTALARYALEHLPVDRVWLVLSPQNPQKDPTEQLPFAYRRDLIECAMGDLSGLELCSLEAHTPSPRYTVRTLRALSLLYPDCDFSMLIGADTLLAMPSWREPERIWAHIPLYVYPRPGYAVDWSVWSGRATVHSLEHVPESELSSSAIRQAIRSGGDMSWALPCPERWGELCDQFARLEHSLGRLSQSIK